MIETATIRALAIGGIAAIALAGCGGATPGSTPSTLLPNAAASANAGKGTASFVVRVHRKKRSGRYLSPATQSMAVTILQGTKTIYRKTVNLTPGSTGCTSTLATTICTLTIGLKAGKYTLSITTYDATNGAGNALSTNQGVPLKVVAGKSNPVTLTLNGIPASILVTSAGTNAVYVLAQDVDGNFIFGPGAPAFTAALTAGAAVAAITQPTATNPNKISFAPAGPSGQETIGVTAAYPKGTNACAEAGAVCSLPSAISAAYGQTLFVSNYNGGNIAGFSLPLTSSAENPSLSLEIPSSSPIVLDPNDNLLVAGYATGAMFESGPPYASAVPTNATGMNDPYWLALDSGNDVFVANYGGSNVTEYAPPYSGAPKATISTAVSAPLAVALDGSNTLYVANNNTTLTAYPGPSYNTPTPVSISLASSATSLLISGTTLYVGETSHVEVFDLPLTGASTAVAELTSGIGSVFSMTLDSSKNLWVANATASTYGSVEEFIAPISNGALPHVTLAQSNAPGASYYPYGVAFDASGNLYVANEGGGTASGGLLEYQAPISSSSAPLYAINTAGINGAYYLAITKASRLTITP